MMSRQKVLLYFAQNPYPGKTGTHKRCLDVIDAFLQMGFEITLFSHVEYDPYYWDEQSIQHFTKKGVKVELYFSSQSDQLYAAHARQQNPDILNLDIHCPPGVVAQYRTLFNKLQPDIVFNIYVFSYGLLAGLDLSSCITIVDSIDLVSISGQLFELMNASLGTPPYNPRTTNPALLQEDFFNSFHINVNQEEFILYDKYDCTLAISSGEAKQIRLATKKTDVTYLPITFPIAELENNYNSDPVFVGADNPFNIQAYLYFAQCVLPAIINHEPLFNLRVIGALTKKLVTVPGVQMVGFVEDLRNVYADACFAVCPIIGGTGMSVKVVEAMAHGIPVIALRSSTQDTVITHGVNGFVVNNAQEFIHYTTLLYKDRHLCAKMGRAAKTTIKEKFSSDLFMQTLATLLAQHSHHNISYHSDSEAKGTADGRDRPNRMNTPGPIVIDGVIFQLQPRGGGISRVWREYLSRLAKLSIGPRLILLDRQGTAPMIDGLRTVTIDAYQEQTAGSRYRDVELLTRTCRALEASSLLSTYFTWAEGLPNALLIYDCVPEVLGWDMNTAQWQAKREAIARTNSFVAISKSSEKDFRKFYDPSREKQVDVIDLSAAEIFQPAPEHEIKAFLAHCRIEKPYYLVCGHRWPHKNTALFLKAISTLPDSSNYEILFTGGAQELEQEWLSYLAGVSWRRLDLSDRELAIAYSGAIALVYPSLYEGFGMPVLEAMRCGCPVITCHNSSIVEVAGDCALYVGEQDVFGMVKALEKVRDQNIREALISGGLERAKRFSWDRSSELMATFLTTLSGSDMESYVMPGIAVSAIVSTYNSECFMRGCLEDLVRQTLFAQGKLEVIIIDSDSPQNEGEIVSEFQARYANIRYIRTPERESIYQAWNRGILAASGRYVTNANTDDRHRSDAFERMAACLDETPDVALVYGDVFVTNLPNQTFEHHIRCGYQLRPDYSPEIMLSGCHMGPQPMWRRNIHEEIGFFSDEYISAGDYEFWCRIARNHRLLHIPQFLGLYFENPEGFANSDTVLSRRETAAIKATYASDFPSPARDYLMNFQFWGSTEETGYANISVITFESMPELPDTLEALLRATEYPHTITVVDRGSSDGTRDFLLAMKRGGIITNLVMLDKEASSDDALETAKNCEPGAVIQVNIEPGAAGILPGWLAGRMPRNCAPAVPSTGNALAGATCEKRPTVLFVMYGWNESGGGTIFPRSVARELARRGYRVSVLYASLANDPALPACSIISEQENSIRLFGMINRQAQFTDPDNPQREIDDPLVRQAFGKVLEEVRPDIVHFHNFHGLTFSIAQETCLRNIPSCFTPHNYHLIDPELYLLKHGLVRWDGVDPLAESDAVARNPHRRDWYRKRIDTTLRLMNQWLGVTLAVSQRQKDLLVRYGADTSRIAVVHQTSPVADDLWRDQAIVERLARPVVRPLQVAYIGGILPIKGVQMLVAAAQSFTPEELQVHLYGFSDPVFEEQLHEADGKRMVNFHGAFDPGNLAEIARGIDVAVIPSIVEESAPTLVLSELFAMRIPVIAARVGGIPEFISEGVDGELYPTYQLDSLVSLLKRFVDDPGTLESMRRNLVAPTHTFVRYMEHLEKVYAALLSGGAVDASQLTLLADKRKVAEAQKQPLISWHGGLFANNSLAHVNRELCLQLLDKGFTISFNPTEPDEFPHSVDSRFNRLETVRNLPLDNPDITIRHQWPPDFTPVLSGKLVLIQPWEFGSLPKEWIPHFINTVDEVWVPSNYVRECYIASGVPQEKVQVVPNGVDTVILTPSVPPLQLKTAKRFRFLFVGGTIHRKGIDLLLGAYHRTFTAADDVCLVIKDMGGASVYQGQTAREVIERFQKIPGAPEIEYIDRMLTPAELAGLYTACHCLVHPYRGEGFGLPIAEAMACGLAPIVTGYGAALDFCTAENAWLIPATVERLPLKQVGNRETVDHPWLAEPDFHALCNLMRHAAADPDAVASRGQVSSCYIREHFTWEQAARKAEERFRVLAAHQTTAVETARDESTVDTTPRAHLIDEVCVRARMQAQRGDVDGAVQTLLNQGIKSDATSPVPYLELAEILVCAGRYGEALQVLPEMPPATDQAVKSELAALCHAALGDDEAAFQSASKVQERPRALSVLGTLAARRGDIAGAEESFWRAVDSDPSCGSGWLSLGMLLWGQGKQDDAWQKVKHAVTVDPLNCEAVRILADMAARTGHLADALEIVCQSVSRYPDSRNLAQFYADLSIRCGYDIRALEACEAFLVRFGTDDSLLEQALELRKRIGVYDRRPETGTQSISLCMIVKDEDKHLARCLTSARPVVHEMIVVDTGSSDRTANIATAFGARVSRFTWNGNFSDARNHAIEQASGAWILVLDADEMLSQRDYKSIADAVHMSIGKKNAWSVLTRNYTTRINAQGWTSNDGAYPAEEAVDGWQPSWKVRLFPRQPTIRFSGEVHEMVESSLRAGGYDIQRASFVIHHYGDLATNELQAAEKRLRYFKAGMQKLEQNPDDLVALTELAVQAGELGSFDEAIQLWDRVLALAPKTVEALFNKGYALIGLKRYQEALSVSAQALELAPNHKEAALNYATCALYVGDPERAVVVAEKQARSHPDDPQLQAILTVLYLSSGNSRVRQTVELLLQRNYAIADYVRDRANVLDQLGRFEPADRLRQGLLELDIKPKMRS